MTINQAIRILDPETTAEELATIEYYGGLHGREKMVAACEEACRMASCPGDGIQATYNVHFGKRTGDKPESRWLEVYGEGRRPALDRRSLSGNGSLSGRNEIEMGSDDL